MTSTDYAKEVLNLRLNVLTQSQEHHLNEMEHAKIAGTDSEEDHERIRDLSRKIASIRRALFILRNGD
jgi:hypothetical protein